MPQIFKFLCLGLLLFFFKDNSKPKLFKLKGTAQGTTYAINYFASDSLVTKGQVDSILNVIDNSMSVYNKRSTISKFNAMAASKIKIDTHFKNVLEKSFQINKETDGLFDITIQPLMRLWGFYKGEGSQLPDTSKISAFLNETTGMDKIKLRNNFLSKKDNHVEIDLNGIAQGYSVDVVADFFERHGVFIYAVEIGGEVRAKGPKPDGTEMRIGVEGPAENQFEDGYIKHIVAVKDGAITTSGNYRKFINYGGKKLGHIINPKTGYPIENEMISVTVYAKKAIDADGYDNALMAMGLEKSFKFLANKNDLEAYIIYKNKQGKVVDTLTPGFKKLIIN